jgi:hypothetical protein
VSIQSGSAATFSPNAYQATGAAVAYWFQLAANRGYTRAMTRVAKLHYCTYVEQAPPRPIISTFGTTLRFHRARAMKDIHPLSEQG